MNCGIYEIVHAASGRRYIGSSKDIGRRWGEHRRQLRRGVHHAPHLQHAWSKHGAEAFSFRVLLVCSREMLAFYEQSLLDGMRPEFNASDRADCRSPIGERTKRAMSASQRAWRPKHAFNGQFLCLSDISERSGLSLNVLMTRMGRGMTAEEAARRGPARKMTKREAV